MKKDIACFHQSIKKHYPGSAGELLAETELAYLSISQDTKFAATSKNPIDKRLDFTARFLGLIRVLDERGESYEAIRAICLEIAERYVQPKNKLHGWFKRMLPRLLIFGWTNKLLKKFDSRVNHNENPEGFVANILTDKAQTYGLGYGVDIIECGICKLFKKHQLERFASILCEVDHLTSSLAGLELIRTGTIALGAKKCDFRWKLK